MGLLAMAASHRHLGGVARDGGGRAVARGRADAGQGHRRPREVRAGMRQLPRQVRQGGAGRAVPRLPQGGRARTCARSRATTAGSKPDACRSCHTDHKGRDVNIVAVRREDVRSREDRFRACRRAPTRGVPDMPRRRKEIPRCAGRLRRLPSQGRQAQGRARPEVRRLPYRERAGRTRASTTARRDSRLRSSTSDVACKDCHANNVFKDTPLTCVGCHRKDDKQHRGRLGEKCEACHTREGLARRRRRSSMTATRSTRCAASTAPRSARAATRRRAVARKAADDLHRMPQGRRQAQRDAGHRLRRLPHRAELARGEIRPRARRCSSCAASIATSNARTAIATRRATRARRRPASAATARTTRTRIATATSARAAIPRRRGATSSSATTATRSTR